MAKKKKEEVVEQTTEQPKVDNTVEKIKVKKKPTMKKLNPDDKPIKVDLSKPPKTEENAEQEEVVEAQVEEILPPQEDEKKISYEGASCRSKATPGQRKVQIL